MNGQRSFFSLTKTDLVIHLNFQAVLLQVTTVVTITLQIPCTRYGTLEWLEMTGLSG